MKDYNFEIEVEELEFTKEFSLSIASSMLQNVLKSTSTTLQSARMTAFGSIEHTIANANGRSVARLNY